MNIPPNRLVALLGPYIALASGALADLLLLHVHLLGAWGISHDAVASMVANVLTFGIGAAIVWLSHQKWLDGWQKWENQIHLSPSLLSTGTLLSSAAPAEPPPPPADIPPDTGQPSAF